MPVNNDMTIEETIEHLDQIAKNQLECADKIDELNCDSTSTRNMASYHKQLAKWLRELKDIKHLFNITEKLFRANFRGGLIDVVDGYDILFSEHKQLREIFEEVDANENDT